MAITRPEDITRLLEILQGFEQFPGRAPGGSGPTGIGHVSSIGHAPSGGLFPQQTAQDYDRLVREQLEYLDLVGDAPTRVRHNFGEEAQPAPTPDPQGYGAGTHEQFMARRPAIESRGLAAIRRTTGR